MPGISRVVGKFTKQNMLYWENIGADEFGKPAFADPVIVKCRWENRINEAIKSDGRSVVAHAYILLTQNVKEGSWVYLGGGKDPIADWKALPGYPDPPTNVQGGVELLAVRTTPDIKAKGFVYEALA